MSKKEFEGLLENNGFLEWAEFAGNFYGTPRDAISQKISEGKMILLEIELAGARQIKHSYPESLMIFLSPPSIDELERRIRERGTETEMSIQKRLTRAREELKAKDEFDAVIVNEDLEIALNQLERELKLVKNTDS